MRLIIMGWGAFSDFKFGFRWGFKFDRWFDHECFDIEKFLKKLNVWNISKWLISTVYK
jgi:hypothetical protein